MRHLSILFVFSFVFHACNSEKKDSSGSNGFKKESEALQVEGMVIQPRSIYQKVEVTGTILANESTEIRPEISGKIVQLNIREGANVQRGSLLVKIFDGDLQAQLKKLEVQLKIAEKAEDRQRELLKIGGISQQDYDLALLQVSNIKADIELTKVNIGKTEIRAPYDGRIGLKNVSPGAYVSPAQLLTTITQLNRIKVEFSVPEKYSAQVADGLPVEVLIEDNGKIYPANVIARESIIDENTRNLRVRALLRDKDDVLVPGSFAKVMIILGKNDHAIMIPSNAVIPQGRNKQVAIFHDGIAKMTGITTGVRDSSRIQVTSGLDMGDTLITTGLMFVKDSAKIKLTQLSH